MVGTEITIKGENFSPTASKDILTFDDISAKITSATKTEIKTNVPTNATDGKIALTIGELPPAKAGFTIVTKMQACYGTDVSLDAKLEWVSQGLTSDGNDKAKDMAIDANSNLYMVVKKRGVVGKFDSKSNKIWSKDVSGKLPKTSWRGIVVDGQKIYIMGHRQVMTDNLGAAKLDYHASKLINNNPEAGTNDPVLARLDAGSGALKWAQEFGSTDYDDLTEETVAVLPSGDILVASVMGGAYTPNNSEPQQDHDVGIAKFSPSGKIQTVKQLANYKSTQGMTTDDQGRVFAGFQSQDGSTRYYVQLNSSLQPQVTKQTMVSHINQPIPYANGEAAIYGSTEHW